MSEHANRGTGGIHVACSIHTHLTFNSKSSHSGTGIAYFFGHVFPRCACSLFIKMLSLLLVLLSPFVSFI